MPQSTPPSPILAFKDTDFLKRNREIDLDFFELMPLATPTYLKNKS